MVVYTVLSDGKASQFGLATHCGDYDQKMRPKLLPSKWQLKKYQNYVTNDSSLDQNHIPRLNLKNFNFLCLFSEFGIFEEQLAS